MNVRAVGAYIRDQRTLARLSLSKLSGLAGVSIPYLSQVERGLRKPSADILQAIAKALRISAETLYVQAGFLEDHPVPDVTAVVLADLSLTERQKQALVQIYEAFREETARARATETAPPQGRPVRARTTSSRKTSASDGGGRDGARARDRSKKDAESRGPSRPRRGKEPAA
jgi:transcriptional regulator with XRE-family HTH domain